MTRTKNSIFCPTSVGHQVGRNIEFYEINKVNITKILVILFLINYTPGRITSIRNLYNNDVKRETNDFNKTFFFFFTQHMSQLYVV